MGKCGCGFTTDEEGNCNGTHKTVKSVREDMADKVEALLEGKGHYNKEDLIKFIRTGK